MNKAALLKLAAGASFLLLLAVQLFGLFYGLGGKVTAAVMEAQPRLFAHFATSLLLTIFVDLLLAFYLLYSLNILGRAKSEYAREFIRIADIGLFLISLLLLADRFCFHRGLYLWSFLLRLLALVVLLRVPMAYRGNPRRLFLPRVCFDLSLGVQLFSLLTVLDLALEPGFRSLEPGWTLALILLLAAASALIGIRLQSPAVILADMAALCGICWRQLEPAQLDARYPAVYISAILMLGVLLAAFIIALIHRRREYWRG